MEIEIEVYGFLSGKLWEIYQTISHNNGNGGSVIMRSLQGKLPDNCLVRECECNTELLAPYYRIFFDSKELSKECLAVLVKKEEGNEKGVEIATTIVARSLAFYKKYKNLFLYERGGTDFQLAMLGVKFVVNKSSGENGFFVPPTAEKEMEFCFVQESNPTFLYKAKWNMYFKSFKDHLPSVLG